MARGLLGRRAKKAAVKTYKRYIRKPKKLVVKKLANTVGQIVAKKGFVKKRLSGRKRSRRRRY